LTYQADPFGALRALLAASRAEGGAGPAPNTQAPPILPGVRRINARQAVADVAPAAAALLARVVSQLPRSGHRPPSVQFLPCCAAERAGGIARSIACAATVLLGRTLLLDATAHGRTAFAADLHEGPMPDAFMPGLYHRQIGSGRSANAALPALDLLAGHSVDAGQFRFIVVDSPAPAIGGAALALAPRCAGSVLVVLAGITRLATVRAAAADLTAAGARLLGTVLLDAPVDTAPRAAA